MSATLTRADDCAVCPGHRRFLLEFRDGDTGKTNQFELINETAQIDELQISSGPRIIVVGRVLPHSSIVTIIDARTGVQVDAFYCFAPSVSANGEMIAFVKVYPTHGAGDFSDEYLIYDLNRSPLQNRGPKAKSVANHVDVGLPIYPAGGKNAPGDNTHVDTSRQHRRVSSGLFWFDNDRALAFADRSNTEVTLVWVDLAKGPTAPEASTIPLIMNEIVDVDRCGEYRDRPELTFSIRGIQSLPDIKTVRLLIKPANADCLRTNVIDISVR